MRNHKSTESSADRQGPLASLMRAAEPLDQLTAAERERIKLRLRGEIAQSRPVVRMRLLTVMAGCGLLLAGGGAVAERWGLIRWPSVMRAPSPGGADVAENSPRPSRARPRATVLAGPAGGDLPSAAEPVAPAPAQATPVPRFDESKTVRPAPAEPNMRPRRASTAAPMAKTPVSTYEAPVRETAPSPLTPPAPELTPPAPPSVAPATVAPPPRPSLAMVTPVDGYPRISKTTPATASAKPNAQDLLGQAMRSLRRQHDPAAALDALARHAALFPESPLAGERIQLEVEAMMALGRYPEALRRLDGMALDKTPRSAERHVVRGELRAQARRWTEAAQDFDQALAHFHGSSPWHERALWGRALARAHAGDRGGSRIDMRLYLQIYPQGRFSAEAARLAEHP